MSAQDQTSIAAYYSQGHYAAYMTAHYALRASEADPSLFSAWSEQSDILQKAVLAYMRGMARDGHLAPVPYSERRRVRWADAWNRMVRHEDPHPHDEARLTEPMDMALSLTINRSVDYPSFVEAMRTIPIRGGPNDCHLTGERMFLEMTAWQPRLGCRESDGRASRFIPLVDAGPEAEVQHVEIALPSGELLLADWFRIAGFTEAVDVDKGYEPLGSAAGRHRATARYAKSHQFLSAHVGNTSPAIYVHGGQLIIGNEDPDRSASDAMPAGCRAGAICSDLWWASAIDRETLTELLAVKEGREAAERLVAEFVHKPDTDLTIVRLPAGSVLHAYFHSDQMLGDDFTTEGADLRGFDTVHVVLSPTPLEWKRHPTQVLSAKRADRLLRP